MKNIFWVLLGALLLFIVLKMIAGAGKGAALSTEKLKRLALLPQTSNLIRTNEFRELVKTKEFKDFVKTLAEEQLTVLAQSLLSAEVKR
jgi:flagellar biosynthesis protein FlhB